MTSLQPSTTSSSHRENTNNEHKLWLSDQWYILVDDEGYLKTACFEGALGCVVKVLSNPSPHPDNVSARGQHQPGQQSLALKFPRLLADSERENAYIAGMLEIEASEVGEVHSDPKPGQDSEPPEAACLMPMQRGRSHILRKPRQMQYADPREAAEQDGCILLVSFQKGMRPRFCSVKPLSGNLTVFPRTMETGSE